MLEAGQCVFFWKNVTLYFVATKMIKFLFIVFFKILTRYSCGHSVMQVIPPVFKKESNYSHIFMVNFKEEK